MKKLKHLSLFSGAGGELLASHYLLGWETIGYVEWIEYRQRAIAARISERLLHPAPIFSDIDTFISEGFAHSYKGMVDILTAGFPCQGWSAIGKHENENDERNKWPQTLEAIRIIQPRQIMLENSPRLMSTGYVLQIIQDLSALNYVGRATRISGLHAGAHSKRERMWIKAELSHPTEERLQGGHDKIAEWEAATRSIQGLGKDQIRLDLPVPGAFRIDHGHPRRVDRTQAIGDMQIPRVAALAWEIL